MKAMKKILVSFILAALLIQLPVSTCFADTDKDAALDRVAYNATLTDAKGGAQGIATMTFDDGYLATAELLNRLCEEYDLKASLMLITSHFDNPSKPDVEDWREVFSEGYLAPESHSANHEYIVPEKNPYYNADNNTEENINDEIVGSLAALNTAFPDTPVLTYAVPYSNYTPTALEVLMKNYYAARLGSCVLSTSSLNGKMQSLDPTHSSAAGGWYNPYMVRMQCNVDAYKSTNSAEAIVKYLQRCVNYGGWFISMCHGATKDDGIETTEEQLRTIFGAMKNYQSQGRLWVATYSEATMYIRERQNSTVEAYATDEGLFVDLTMNEKTKEGLSLSPEVFNMPLTVKLELPSSWKKITYRQGEGEEIEASAFKEGGVNFVYLDLVPNGGTASITNVGDPTEYVKSLNMKQNVNAAASLSYNIYLPTDSEVSEVYVGKNRIDGEPLEDGTTKYSVGNIAITDIMREYSFTIKFNSKTEFTDYEFKRSVIQYFDDLTLSSAVTEGDMQLSYDFLLYARASLKKFGEHGEYTDTQKIDNLLTRFSGYTSSLEELEAADMGTIKNVLTGAAFAINEKPYYLFYVKPGFTGTLTVSYGDSSTSYDVINGYYHCKDYVIFEVESVYELTSVISITAEGVIDGASASARGEYSLATYIDGLKKGEESTEYEMYLCYYAISAKNYKENN